MKKYINIVIFVFLALLACKAVAECGEPGNAPCDPYYHIYTTEPDWCTYQNDDGVFLEFSGTNIVGYYIVPSTDHTTQPPQGFQTFRWTVCINCDNLPCGYYF